MDDQNYIPNVHMAFRHSQGTKNDLVMRVTFTAPRFWGYMITRLIYITGGFEWWAWKVAARNYAGWPARWIPPA